MRDPPPRLSTPGLRVLGRDRSGSWVVGLPPVRVVEQCSVCKEYLDSSMFRSRARACRPCERWSEEYDEPTAQHRDQETHPSESTREHGALEPFRDRSLARARLPPSEPPVNEPPTGPQTLERSHSRTRARRDAGGYCVRFDATNTVTQPPTHPQEDPKPRDIPSVPSASERVFISPASRPPPEVAQHANTKDQENRTDDR